MKQYIVAGTHAEFMAWKIRKIPSEVQDAVYVSSVDTLRGVTDPHGLYIGSYLKRPDLHDIQVAIKIAQIKPATYTWKNPTPNPFVGVLAQEMSDAIDADVLASAVKNRHYLFSINGVVLSSDEYTYNNSGYAHEVLLKSPLGNNDTLEVITKQGTIFMFAGTGMKQMFTWNDIR